MCSTERLRLRVALFFSHSCILQEELGFSMDLLDIGGGFPGSEDTELKFEEVSN